MESSQHQLVQVKCQSHKHCPASKRVFCIEEGPGNITVVCLDEHSRGYVSNSSGGSMTPDLLRMCDVISMALVF